MGPNFSNSHQLVNKAKQKNLQKNKYSKISKQKQENSSNFI